VDLYVTLPSPASVVMEWFLDWRTGLDGFAGLPLTMMVSNVWL
jgi:hypothetical protein